MNAIGAIVAHTMQQPHESIAGGLLIATALWSVIGRLAVRGLRWVVRKTPTKVDDKVVDKLGKVTGWLADHPEVVEVLHKGISDIADGGK